MLQTELPLHDMTGDPAPSFASDAEIAVADRLRRRLEERYLSPSTAPPLEQERASNYGR